MAVDAGGSEMDGWEGMAMWQKDESAFRAESRVQRPGQGAVADRERW